MTRPITLVLGATGKTGRRLVPRLRMLGASVRPASRSTTPRFDWADERTWDAVLDGVESIYLVPSATVGRAAPFLARAASLGVERVVVLSGHGADRWSGAGRFGRDMLDAEDAARASSLAWTILRPSNFAQDFTEEFFHAPLVAGELALPAAAVPEPFIDVEDVAAVAAEILVRPASHAGRTYELTGPASWRFDDAVALIARATGRSLRYRRTDADEYADLLRADGVGEADVENVVAMFQMMASGTIAETTTGVVDVLGRAPATFEDFVARAAAADAWSR